MFAKFPFMTLMFSSTLYAAPGFFDPIGPSQSDFGGVGLLQMPTARMAKEGEFSFNYMDNQEYRRWSVSLQPFEWLEATLRYTDTRTQPYSPNPEFSGNQTNKDKGIDFKFRLLKESTWLPQTSLGFRDFMGTGLFDGEYLAASKRYGPLDFTLGIGWGHMAESGNLTNPFCKWKESWCYRDPSFSGKGGKFELDSLFHGPAALFGGIEYQTPWQPLRLKLEYDGNNYRHEFAGDIAQNSAWNVGAVYRLFDAMDMHLSYQRGNTLMWGFTFRTNFNTLTQNHLDEPRASYTPNSVAATQERVNWPEFSQRLTDNAGYHNSVFYGNERTVTLVGEQQKYRQPNEAETRAALLAVNTLPTSVNQLRIIEQNKGFTLKEVITDLDSVRQAKSDQPLGQEVAIDSREQRVEPIVGSLLYQTPKKSFNYSFDPALNQSLGGPESFYMYQIGVNADAEWQISAQNWLSGTLFVNVYNNYDKFNYKTPPLDGEALPRVRTWIREYVDSSDLLLNNLQFTHLQQWNSDWYGQAYAGYLEMMYAGGGGELLYRPFNQSWAIGLDTNWVKQRDWTDTLRMADYDVVTGHLTTYWQPFFLENVTSKISVGRYLAGDYGATFDFSKRFQSGIVAGVFATFTNVSAEEYGEGSYTKGIYISIPFDLMLVKPTTSRGSISWIPLTRDGGQMLNRRYSLYELSSHASFQP